MTKDTGGPAFPQNDLSGYGMGPSETGNGGMTMRDWFAGQFLAGAAVGSDPLDQYEDEPVEIALSRHWANVAMAAYIAADAMIAERAKQ